MLGTGAADAAVLGAAEAPMLPVSVLSESSLDTSAEIVGSPPILGLST